MILAAPMVRKKGGGDGSMGAACYHQSMREHLAGAKLALHYRNASSGAVPSILLKNVPPALHRRLKLRAAAQRRSLQQEVMVVLEHGLSFLDAAPHNRLPPPVPLKMKVPLTQAFLDECKKERDARR